LRVGDGAFRAILLYEATEGAAGEVMLADDRKEQIAPETTAENKASSKHRQGISMGLPGGSE
jgi:hypothetical protein